MGTKHTPGPWKIAKDNYGVERVWDSRLDCDIACCEGDGSLPREERVANTRLIAAAPELLAALKAAWAGVSDKQRADLNDSRLVPMDVTSIPVLYSTLRKIESAIRAANTSVLESRSRQIVRKLALK